MINYMLQPSWNEKRRIFSLLILCFFAVYLYCQHQLIFPYHDDWGYASLSYTGEVQGGVGQDFTQGQLLHFLYGEYQRWSGRFFGFFIQINLFEWGIDYVRFIQSTVLLLIFCFSVRLSTDRWLHPVSIVPVLYFFGLPTFIVTDGLYWFSASIAYVWGILPLLAAAFLLQRSGRLELTSSLLLGCAALFHEQMAVVVMVFVWSFLCLEFWMKKSIRGFFRQAAFALPAVFASCLVVLAPGNFERKKASTYTSDSLVDVATSNLNIISEYILGSSESLLILVWLVASLGIYIVLMLCNKPIGKVRSYWTIVVSVLGLMVLSFVASWSFLAMATFLVMYGLILVRLYVNSEQYGIVLCLYVSAIASFVLLLLAPGVSGRSLTIFYLLMMVPTTHAFYMATRNGRILLVSCMVAVLVPFSLINVRNIYLGYAQNHDINVINNYKLNSLSYDLQHGISDADSIVLYKLVDDHYAATMPYQRPIIEKWIKRYYALPPGLTLHWQ